MPGRKENVGTLVQNAYGKSRVRLSKVTRHKDRHELQELSVDVLLQGDFADTYTQGNNSKVVATDSIRNTVYVLAAEHELKDIESFARDLSSHFLKTYAQVEEATVSISQDLWQRIDVNGTPHHHAFYGAGGEKRYAQAAQTRDKLSIISGIDDLRLVKTTDSEFVGFVRDRYTTLAEVKDRIFGTTVQARWLFASPDNDFNHCYELIRGAIFDVFATHMSLSVQQTMNEAGQQALARCACIKEITLIMPNQHRIPFNLQPFGLENKNEIFVTTDEPYGLISATIVRN